MVHATSVSSLSSQSSFPGNLQLVLVLRPTALLQRTLSDIFFKFNKDEFKMKVPVCTATERLNAASQSRLRVVITQ